MNVLTPQYSISLSFANGESAWKRLYQRKWQSLRNLSDTLRYWERMNIELGLVMRRLILSLGLMKDIINSTWLSLYQRAWYEKANQCQWQTCRRSIFCRENVIIRYTSISPEFLTLSPSLLVICRFNGVRLYHLFYNLLVAYTRLI